MTELLVSVRSVSEAESALDAGAAIIDVKEPARGSLGRADQQVVEAVVEVVGGRVPVSAALGELLEAPLPFPIRGLNYVKWGLAACGQHIDWPECLTNAAASLRKATPLCRMVTVAYADWERANSPAPDAVCAFACAHEGGVFLLDTWRKDGSTLLDWLRAAEVCRLAQCCKEAGVRVALAGSLGLAQIPCLLPAEPDWIAVRGAVCKKGMRNTAIDPGRVRTLVQSLKQPVRAATRGS
ncbi:MAG TPA: (5-formylfuran-3-yl)methyl phosphate synthase [Gemmataceae bacterium]|nr:(5-formylfuran-3-yl)methyl phosphate synthase [Gemmataceae bacterium]